MPDNGFYKRLFPVWKNFKGFMSWLNRKLKSGTTTRAYPNHCLVNTA